MEPVTEERRLVIAARLAQVSEPIPPLGSVDLSGEIARAETAVEGLRKLSWKSDQAFMAAGALENVSAATITNPITLD